MIKALQNEIEKMRDKIEQCKKELKKKILSLPDNPKIKRLDNRCFTIKFSDLGNNWSPKYHDFKAQYEIICEQIDKLSFEQILKFLQTIVNTGKYRFWEQNYTMIFHPTVVQFLKELGM